MSSGRRLNHERPDPHPVGRGRGRSQYADQDLRRDPPPRLSRPRHLGRTEPRARSLPPDPAGRSRPRGGRPGAQAAGAAGRGPGGHGPDRRRGAQPRAGRRQGVSARARGASAPRRQGDLHRRRRHDRRVFRRARRGRRLCRRAGPAWNRRRGPLRPRRDEENPMKIHYEADCPPELGEPVAVIGYGSQGRAHALNLRDSGEDVRVGLYPGSKSIERVEADGLRAVPVPEAVSEASVVMVLTPDAGRAGVLETTFKEETETDLFGEQAVLCGGVANLVKTGFETLVEAGYQPELAYFEVLHELKLIVDLMYRGGLGFMRYSVSDTAEFGDYVSGPRVIDDHVRQQMRQVLSEIQDGSFAERWLDENSNGREQFMAMRQKDAQHQIEQVGRELRSMMTWLEPVEK